MTSTQYIGMDVHKESISIAVRNAAGKIVMECVIETKRARSCNFSMGCAETCTSRLRKEPGPESRGVDNTGASGLRFKLVK